MSTKKIIIISAVSFFLLLLIAAIVFGIFYLNGTNPPKESPAEKYYFDVGEMYCNLKDTGRIAKLNITIEVTDEELIEVFTNKDFLIKDEINKIIRSKNEEDIEGSNGQIMLQEEITKTLKEIFQNDKINNIYFKEFIVQ
ncbi:flagellar basal body-associated FliL family protein [Thermohalobacter berrensis]|uniref:Flagellar protein FliL n=1 Tax=Thermohalobacter berrensis TaxID=99594 RepID=A0A419TAF1_9FIRM|nr:flagellar basal body-associated FliL family protein [Thermohalobacter berrensis]RKD34443.1 hypothetical protein BET03_01010 [Thermohalobacter berrensis]